MRADVDAGWQRPEEECDLVMKGGVTSGAVYPTAIREIARRYRLRSVGGASAGAVAAVAAAACEYARNRGQLDAFGRLDDVIRQIEKEGFVLRLFQPTERGQPALRVALSLAKSEGRFLRRLLIAVRAILRERKRYTFAAAIAPPVWAGLVVTTAAWALAQGGWSGRDVAAMALLGVLVLLGLIALVLFTAGLGIARFALDVNRALVENRLGLCSGRTEDGYPDRSALTDWLHDTVQRCAGLDRDEPLTFRMLQGGDPHERLVDLRLVTTDLSASRPLILPLPEPDESEEPPYLFSPDEFEQLFPSEIVAHMKRCARGGAQTFADMPGREFYAVPTLDLPIVVAARLSLSFPMLLSTVPLWKDDVRVPGIVRHTMSDGGISSNFPIHFFDSLFPGRPTFGLDLQPWRVPDLPPVEMSDEPRPPQFTEVADLGGFWMQLVNAARNWRDNMQAELPGYRDRICQIRLSAHEGGLNLDMPAPVVQDLFRRGEDAGKLVVSPHNFNWDRHRVTRYRTFMQMLQRSLGREAVAKECVYRGRSCGRRRPFRDLLEDCRRSKSNPIQECPGWCKRAIAATDAVLGLAAKWGRNGDIDFDERAPRPTPTIRIVPTA